MAPVILGTVILFFGLIISNYFGFYSRISYLDNIYHYLGGLVLGWFFYNYFTGSDFKMSEWNLILISVSVVCFIGVIWEFAERLSSVYSPEYFPWLYRWFHGGQLNDTLIDLFADMLGGLTFVSTSLYLRQK